MNIEDLEKRVQESEKHGTCKVNIAHGEGNEGIWACFATQRDRQVYDENKLGETFEVFLMNHALIGGPCWGGRLKLTANGVDTRPTILVADVIRQMKEAVAAGDYPTADKFTE